MAKIWTKEEEAARLSKRFEAVPNLAKWARENSLRGGPSMLSQHLHGHRGIGLDHAVVYARGFGVSLAEISPRLAKEEAGRAAMKAPATATVAEPDAAYGTTGSLATALWAVHHAIAKSPAAALTDIRLQMAALAEGVRPAETIEALVQLLAPTPAQEKRRTA